MPDSAPAPGRGSPARRSRRSWLLITALVVAASFTTFHVVRSVRDFVFWHIHADEPIQPWMTLGFVSHAYHLPPHVLHRALGMPIGPPDHRPIERIAKAQGMSYAALRAKLYQAIALARAPRPRPSRPTPPPPSPLSPSPPPSPAASSAPSLGGPA